MSGRVLVRRFALERAAHGDDVLGRVGPFDALPAGLLPLRLERGDLCGFDAVTGVSAAAWRAQPCVVVVSVARGECVVVCSSSNSGRVLAGNEA